MDIKIYENEELLSAENNRFVLFPIKHQDIWNMCKKQLDCFWRTEEIDLSKDLKRGEVLTLSKSGFFLANFLFSLLFRIACSK